MAEVWYKAQLGKIEAVLVEKETGKFVVLSNGRREAKDSGGCWFRRDREEAKQAMVAAYEFKCESARLSLDAAEEWVAAARAA